MDWCPPIKVLPSAPYWWYHTFAEHNSSIEDPTSRAGKQIIQLDEVNLDEIPIADFKADDTVMDISADFTFEGIHLVQPFDGIQ